MSEKPAYSPGLEGVIAGESALSRIDAERNCLLICGYDLEDLTEGATYEEVAYLLLHGELPTRAQLEEFGAALRAERALPPQVLDLLRQAPAGAHPMDLLRTAVSALSFFDPETRDNSPQANTRKALRLLARIPLIIAAGHRFSQGLQPIAPHPTLGQAGNLLYMLRGSEPAPHEVRALDVSLILYSEHGFNASTFTARVVISTLSDLYSAVSAAIGALAGPLHGGANEAAMHMLLEIGSAERAEAWVLDALASKKKIMGFGHREYKKGDSRVPAMKKVGRQVAAAVGDTRWIELAEIVERTMITRKGIHPNLDFPCAYTYYLLNIPIPLYTPIFVSSRVAGWAAHVIEQLGRNRLIRPAHLYRGQDQRPFRPVDARG
jgi:citrate synthase